MPVLKLITTTHLRWI